MIQLNLFTRLFRYKAAPNKKPHSKTASKSAALSKSTDKKISARPVQIKYDALVTDMKKQYGLRIRKWRTSMTGCAWSVTYTDGTESRLIEAPYPKGPMSAVIFLHEVGHHAIGLGTYKPRCLEEYYAWLWAVNMLQEKGFTVTKGVQKRMRESLNYAVAKARRRGLKKIPDELIPYA